MLGRRLIGAVLFFGAICFGLWMHQDASAHTYSGTCPSEQTLKACPAGYTDGYLYLPIGTVTCSIHDGAVSKTDKRYHDATSHHNDLGGYCYKGATGTRSDGSGVTNVGNATRYSSESACRQVACVPAPIKTPTLTLKANNTTGAISVPYGTSATLSWTTTDVSSCTATGDWSGTKQPSGSQSTGTLTTSKKYYLICTGTSGNLTVNQSVDVNVIPAPTVDLKVNNSNGPITITSGSASNLAWTSTNTTSCTASGAWSGVKSVNGNQSTGNLTTSQSYTITCTGAGGVTASDSVTVVVNIPPAPTVDLKANNTAYSITVAYNTAATLSWTSTNATSCTASNGWSGTKATSGSQSTGNLTATKTYTLSCSSGSQTASSSVTVNVTPPAAPTVDIKANNSNGPLSITSGTAASLTWTSTNATSCTASNGWSGAKAVNGTLSTGNLTASAIYVLTCTGAGGSASDSVTVSVTPPPAPTVSIKANNTLGSLSISYNTAATLSWTSTNATSCTASNGWSGAKAVNGTLSTGNLTVSKTYTLTCTGLGNQTTSSSVTVTVNSPSPTVDIRANNSQGPLNVTSGTAATLSWTSTNATSCTASNGFTGTKPINGSESSGALTVSKTYTLTCTGAGGSISDSVTVNVAAASAPTVDIKANNSNGPLSITSGTAASLTWTSTNATSCVASNGFTGTKATSGTESTGNLTTSKTYTITCTGTGGSIADSVTVNVAAATLPTVAIKANNTLGSVSIPYNTAASLSWTSTNATSCTASNGWSGAKAVNGSESTGNLTTTKTYTITCTGSNNQTAASSVTVNVTSAVVPTLILKANNSIVSTAVAYNTAATLTWPTTDATSCWATGDWSGWKTIGGSESTGNLTVSKTYSLQCWSASGVATPVSSVTVNVTPPAAPTVDIKANNSNGPLSITSGTAASLTWTSTNATSCVASNGFTGTKATSGTESTGNLTTSKTYTITCTGTGGSIADSVTVTINSPANDRPSAVARIGVNGSPFSSSVTVTKGVPVTLTLDASSSSDADGWTTAGTGVSQGGKCEWNTDLNAGTPTFERTVANPATPASCNTSLGLITFNDNPGTYTYNALRITDAAGAVSSVATISVTVMNPVGSQAPVAVAKFIVNGGLPSSSITVTRGVPVTIDLDASASSDPDGWTTPGTGVSQGGKCEWNTNLDQSKPASFKQTILNPTTPAACNISLGTLTFNDAPGTYSYTLLRITDASGSRSIASYSNPANTGLFARLFSSIPAANAAFAEQSVSVTVVE